MPAAAAAIAVVVIAVLVVRNRSTSETVATRASPTSLPTVPPNLGSLLAPLLGSVPGLDGLTTEGAPPASATPGGGAGGGAGRGAGEEPTAGGAQSSPGSGPSGEAQAGGDGGQLPQSLIDTICNLVRTAGLAPLHRGDPGFSPYLDPDGNGLACEQPPGSP